MKTKLGLIIAVVLGVASASAFAYERDGRRDDDRGSYTEERRGDWDRRGDWGRRGDLDRQINRMNRMLAHVKSHLSRYRGDWRIRREVNRISDEVSRVNWRFEHRRNHRELREDVQRLRNRLHRIEEQLHFRSRDFFRWD